MDISRDDLTYTKCYCEENIWLLCQRFKQHDPQKIKDLRVVFVSNDIKAIPLWRQRSGDVVHDGRILWDYHVILVDCHRHLLYDFDTSLEFPVDFDTYFESAIRPEDTIKKDYHRKFRVIEASAYLEHFSSDRRHMRIRDNEWTSPPPAYEPIQSATCDHNLEDFISMDQNRGWGVVLDLKSFFLTFTDRDERI